MTADHDGLMPVEEEITRLMNVERVNAGVPIPCLADHLGVWVSTMTNRITAYQVKTVKVGDMVAICDAIGVSPSRLLAQALETTGPTAPAIDGIWKEPRNKRVWPVTSANNSTLSPVDGALMKMIHQTRADAGVSIPALAEHLGWPVPTTNSRVTGHNRKHIRLGHIVAICDSLAVDAAALLEQAHESEGPSVRMIDGVVVPDRYCEYEGCGQPLAKFDLDAHHAEGKRYMLATRRYCCDQHRWRAAYQRSKHTA